MSEDCREGSNEERQSGYEIRRFSPESVIHCKCVKYLHHCYPPAVVVAEEEEQDRG